MAIVFVDAAGNVLAEAPCLRGLNLLGHANFEELEIGSSCGGHGICGGDRVRIAEADRRHFSPPTEAEREHLGEEALTRGWRLGCQCWPAEDGLSVRVVVRR